MLFADGHAPSNQAVETIVKNRFPGCSGVTRANVVNDKGGTDYWIHRLENKPLRVDLKIRSKDFGLDDLALETWSVMPNGRPGVAGWTRDAKKNSDFILWYWQDTRRFFLVNFPALCFVFDRYWQLWASRYRTEIQTSGSWQSQCVFVPRETIVKAICQWQSSNLDFVER